MDRAFLWGDSSVGAGFIGGFASLKCWDLTPTWHREVSETLRWVLFRRDVAGLEGVLVNFD